MTVVVPTLSQLGWAISPEDKAYFLFSHFYESEKNQTRLYGNNVSNLQFLVSRYSHDIPEFCSKLGQTLEAYLGRHFDSVNVEINHDASSFNTASLINVTISTDVYVSGRKYSFGHLVEMNGKITKLLTMINGGYV